MNVELSRRGLLTGLAAMAAAAKLPAATSAKLLVACEAVLSEEEIADIRRFVESQCRVEAQARVPPPGASVTWVYDNKSRLLYPESRVVVTRCAP